MGRIILTDKAVEKAKEAPPGSRNSYWDALVPSLALRVTDKGHKSWVVQRRVNGKMLRITLGDYPRLSVADARKEALHCLEDMTRGRDPRQTATIVKASSPRKDSFEVAVERYISTIVEPQRRPRVQDEIIRPLRQIFVKRWGTLALSEISKAQVREVLDEIAAENHSVKGKRTHAVIKRFFKWAVSRDLLETNPAAIDGAWTKEQKRERVLSDDELREVWIHAQELQWPYAPFVRALILTTARRNEVAGIAREELDLDRRVWTLPASRSKNGRSLELPIVPALNDILEAAPRFKPPKDYKGPDYVFTTTATSGISGFSVAKRRLDALILAARKKAAIAAGEDPERVSPPPGWTFHDLRRTGSTGMQRLGVAPHVVDLALNHSGFRSGVAGVYLRHDYLDERRTAFELWGRHVLALADPGRSATVVAMRRPA